MGKIAISNIFNKNYVSRSTALENFSRKILSDSKIWYIPYFGVIKYQVRLRY